MLLPTLQQAEVHMRISLALLVDAMGNVADLTEDFSQGRYHQKANLLLPEDNLGRLQGSLKWRDEYYFDFTILSLLLQCLGLLYPFLSKRRIHQRRIQLKIIPPDLTRWCFRSMLINTLLQPEIITGLPMPD